MDRSERFYRIDQLLRARRAVPRAELLDALEVSPATLKRDLGYMRDRLHAPIVWDPALGGYRFTEPEPGAPRYQLPGLWFSASELQALLTIEQLLDRLDPGLLRSRIGALRARIRELLGSGPHSADEVARRIKLLALATRRVDLAAFEAVSAALLARRRLSIRHFSRQTGAYTERVVSPQRLAFYRDNWYLDAWCHLRGALRTFAVDALESAGQLDLAATEISDDALDAHFRTGYGIFAGQAQSRAVLRFTPERARWVSRERWHDEQSSRFEPDGSYLLEVPYADDRELLMDILKFGADCEVLAPPALRARVAAALAAATAVYGLKNVGGRGEQIPTTCGLSAGTTGKSR